MGSTFQYDPMIRDKIQNPDVILILTGDHEDTSVVP
jgi:hypothetical protein